MMLGLLLARSGIDVVVHEKHADFLRDFRGDTIHPSTLEVIAELGLLDELLKLPHQKLRRLGGQFGDTPISLADFSHLPTQCGYVIPKGGTAEVHRAGLAAFHAGIVRLLPFAAERAGEIRDWDQVKLLTVKVDRLKRWYGEGLLCIGDAAHAMSPVGGVGINL